MTQHSVLVVGAGISGIACAQALRAAGIAVRVVDRGRREGGRMGSSTIGGRSVDLGASYFTAEPGSRFADVAAGWVSRGLAREWTDTIAVAGPAGIIRQSTGPMRYAAPGGLRELVVDLAATAHVERRIVVEHVAPGEADGRRYDTVVLAMPDPQARRLLDPTTAAYGELDAGGGWDPTIAVVLEWAARDWPTFRAAFVNDSDELTSVADDGDRRGDGAPVLVAHTTARLARAHLDDPDGAIAPVTAAVQRLLGISAAPVASTAHRWTFSRPTAQHPEPFHLSGGIGVCGDAWGARSSVATAWASGDALGRAIAASAG